MTNTDLVDSDELEIVNELDPEPEPVQTDTFIIPFPESTTNTNSCKYKCTNLLSMCLDFFWGCIVCIYRLLKIVFVSVGVCDECGDIISICQQYYSMTTCGPCARFDICKKCAVNKEYQYKINQSQYVSIKEYWELFAKNMGLKNHTFIKTTDKIPTSIFKPLYYMCKHRNNFKFFQDNNIHIHFETRSILVETSKIHWKLHNKLELTPIDTLFADYIIRNPSLYDSNNYVEKISKFEITIPAACKSTSLFVNI